MTVNRWAPAASVLALCLGLVFIFGLRPVPPATVPPPAVVVATNTPLPSPALSPTLDPTLSPSPTATPATTMPPGYRIRIPRLTIDLPIAEGDLERDTVRQETPEDFAFHLPGTAIPGVGGNTYLYAHARTGMFLSLWRAREGDEVWIITPDARELRYVVREVHARVDPTDVSWAARGSSERLTLQTSTGPNPNDPRFVVVALPV